MSAKNSSKESATYYKIDGGKKDSRPFFGKKGSKEQGYKVIEEFDTFEGNLLDIELGSYEFEGKTKDTIKLSFEDGIGKDVVEGSLNTGIMRSILNTFAGSDFNKPYTMKMYLNKEGYPSIYITQGGERASWKYEASQVPKAEVIVLKNKTEIKDDTEVIEWFKKLVTNELKPRLKDLIAPSKTALPDIKDMPTEQPKKSMVSGSQGLTEDESSELPF